MGSGEIITFVENSEPLIIDDEYVVFECLKSGVGLLQANGQLIIEPVWESVSIPCCDVIRASSEDKCCYFDLYGDLLFECTNGMNFSDGVALVTNDSDDTMIIDKRGRILYISSGELDNFGCEFHNGLCEGIDCKTGKYGYVGTDGRWVISPIYDRAFGFYDGYGVVAIAGRYGLIDIKGEIVIDFLYEMHFVGENGLISAKENGKFGIINTQNEVVYPM